MRTPHTCGVTEGYGIRMSNANEKCSNPISFYSCLLAMKMVVLKSIRMGHSLVSLNVHIVFRIKHNSCFMKEEHLSRIFQYIAGTIRALEGYAYIVGGRPDHIHILTSLPATISLAEFVRSIKACSSKWIKRLTIEYEGFAWQEGYGAFSVSESRKSSVITYIENQKTHHQKYSTEEEYLMFLKNHRLDIKNTPET